MNTRADTTSITDRPADPIFIVGAPRSGTTWLAKIFDSHPDVLYRHEPDHDLPLPADPTRADVQELVAKWCANTRLRTAAKRPFFHKNWQSAPAMWLRAGMSNAMTAIACLPGMRERSRRWSLPDLGHTACARIVIKTVESCDGIGMVTRQFPESRVIVILRRPRAQVFSMMRGARQGRFELRKDGALPIHEARAMVHAAQYGIDSAAFFALPDAAKYAWNWVAFNETLEQGIAGQTNAMTVLYENLSRQPELVSRQLLEFTGLPWNPQTEAFIRASSSARTDSGYYGVVQNTPVIANRWRADMPIADRRAVVAVVRQTNLARHWPDLLKDEA